MEYQEVSIDYGLSLFDGFLMFQLDLAIDGADEVDEQFNCIKGGGGCQTQEKLVAICAKKFIVIADEKYENVRFRWIETLFLCNRKWSKKLGEKWEKGIPIEVLPIAYKITKKEIEKQLGGEAVVREGTEKLVGYSLLNFWER